MEKSDVMRQDSLLKLFKVMAGAVVLVIGTISSFATDIKVTVEASEGATMRFKVTPGDGTATRAFLRLRK